MKAPAQTAANFVQGAARLVDHAAVSSRYYRMVLHCPGVARRARPGQFVLVACRPDGDGTADPLLPRPMALLDASPEAGNLELLYFVAGRGTALLKQAAEEATRGGKSIALRIIGPLGRGFEPLPGVEAHVGVGGGSGCAPLVYFFRRWRGEPDAARVMILGARTAAELPREQVLSAPGTILRLATNDGSAGFHGTAADALAALLDGELGGKRAALYAAGPEPMLRAAVHLARARRLPIRISLEARMACGVGVCRACVVNGRLPHPKTGLLRRTVCQDGPVFDPDELAGDWSDVP